MGGMLFGACCAPLDSVCHAVFSHNPVTRHFGLQTYVDTTQANDVEYLIRRPRACSKLE